MSQYEEDVKTFENLIKDHTNWMKNSINLIASENITSSQVKTALASDLSHRYAEGLAGQRLYEGCKYIDEIEEKTIDLSKKLFNAEFVNVQPISGVTANLATFFAFTKPGDKIMTMSVPMGGHISHENVSAAGIRGLKNVFYPFNLEIMNIDADKMQKQIREKEPNIVLLGGSLFLFPHPVKEAVEAAQEVGAKVLYDGAHVLGLIAGGQFQDPIGDGVDALMGSTHKTFPGPQGGIIFSKKEYSNDINNAVFPGIVSNHHLHHLAGLGIATAEMMEFGEEYAKQTIKNAQALAQALYERGFNVMCEDLGFTESHQVAMNVSNIKKATILAKELESNNVILNKNLIPGDDVNHSDDPSGIRMGTQELTRRGMKESEMDEVAEFIKRVAIDNEEIKDDVTEFMKDFTNVHYAFKEDDGYQYIQF